MKKEKDKDKDKDKYEQGQLFESRLQFFELRNGVVTYQVMNEGN